MRTSSDYTQENFNSKLGALERMLADVDNTENEGHWGEENYPRNLMALGATFGWMVRYSVVHGGDMFGLFELAMSFMGDYGIAERNKNVQGIHDHLEQRRIFRIVRRKRTQHALSVVQMMRNV